MYPHFLQASASNHNNTKIKIMNIYFFENLFCIRDLKSAITNPKNSMKVITEAPKANPSQPPTVAEKRITKYTTMGPSINYITQN